MTMIDRPYRRIVRPVPCMDLLPPLDLGHSCSQLPLPPLMSRPPHLTMCAHPVLTRRMRTALPANRGGRGAPGVWRTSHHAYQAGAMPPPGVPRGRPTSPLETR